MEDIIVCISQGKGTSIWKDIKYSEGDGIINRSLSWEKQEALGPRSRKENGALGKTRGRTTFFPNRRKKGFVMTRRPVGREKSIERI